MWAQFFIFLTMTVLAFKLSPIPESADLGQILIGVGILGLGAMLGIATIIPCIRRLREKIAVLERNLDTARKDGNKNWGLYGDKSAAHARTKDELAATEAELGNARHQLSNAWGALGITVSDPNITLAQAISRLRFVHDQESAQLQQERNAAQAEVAQLRQAIQETGFEFDPDLTLAQILAGFILAKDMETARVCHQRDTAQEAAATLEVEQAQHELDAFLQGADHYSELEIQERIEQARIEAYEAALLRLYTEVFDDGRRDAYEGMVDTPTAKQVVAGLFDTILDLERQLGEALDLLDETRRVSWDNGFITGRGVASQEVASLVEALVLQVAHNVLLELELEGAITALDDSIKLWMGRWAKATRAHQAAQSELWQTQLEVAEAKASMTHAYDAGYRRGKAVGYDTGYEAGRQAGDAWGIAQVFTMMPQAVFDGMAVDLGYQPGYRPVAKAPTFTPDPADVQNAVLGLVIADQGGIAPHFLRLLHDADDANGFGGLLPSGD